MYLNNRAVESLTRGAVAHAYWWAREAIAKDPELRSSYLTLGVVYRAAHRPKLADAVLSRLLERRPDDTLANRIGVLRDLERPTRPRRSHCNSRKSIRTHRSAISERA